MFGAILISPLFLTPNVLSAVAHCCSRGNLGLSRLHVMQFFSFPPPTLLLARKPKVTETVLLRESVSVAYFLLSDFHFLPQVLCWSHAL